MTANGWLQILLYSALILAVTKPLGIYMYRVFEGERQPLPRVLRTDRALPLPLLRRRSDARAGLEAVHARAAALQRVRHAGHLRDRSACRTCCRSTRRALARSSADSAFNTAASFTTNTNWQALRRRVDHELPHPDGGPRLAQLHLGGGRHRVAHRAGARLHPPAGARRRRDGIGNFWVDLIRGIALRAAAALHRLRSAPDLAGRDPELQPVRRGRRRSRAPSRRIAMGPVASQEAIKQLGTNGGGFFNANSAHPFENPTPLTNFLEMFLIFAIPAALTYTFGRMARDQRQGWALFAAMARAVPRRRHAWPTTPRRGGNPVMQGLAVDQGARQHGGQGGALRRRQLRRSSPPSPPTPPAARSTRCTTASRRSAASCRWSTSSSAR